MKNLLQELNNIKDDASLRNFVENANEEKLLNACLLCLPNDFKNVEEIKEYIIATLGEEDGNDDFMLDLECYFEGCALSFFKSEEEYNKIMEKI